MLNLTDDEREAKLQAEFPNSILVRYIVGDDFWDRGSNCYDMPSLARDYFDILYTGKDKPKDLEKWMSEHYVGNSTETRWRFKYKDEKTP